jgi:hypothetical protein
MASYDKFKNRFEIIEIEKVEDVTAIIDKYNINFFYDITHGIHDPTWKLDDKSIWKNCKTIKHAVFNTTGPEGDYYCCISEFLNKKFKTNVFCLPHIVDLPNSTSNLRDTLGIPKDAIVFGRYGGYDTFSIGGVYQVINDVAAACSNIYFLFMNTRPFCPNRKNIIHMEMTTSLDTKAQFINTCDAMIHARMDGETFGLSCGEFAIKNKNIISCPSGDRAHIEILQDKIILYNDARTLIDIFLNFNKYKKDMSDNGYKKYTPEAVMKIFNTILTSPQIPV